MNMFIARGIGQFEGRGLGGFDSSSLAKVTQNGTSVAPPLGAACGPQVEGRWDAICSCMASAVSAVHSFKA